MGNVKNIQPVSFVLPYIPAELYAHLNELMVKHDGFLQICGEEVIVNVPDGHPRNLITAVGALCYINGLDKFGVLNTDSDLVEYRTSEARFTTGDLYTAAVEAAQRVEDKRVALLEPDDRLFDRRIKPMDMQYIEFCMEKEEGLTDKELFKLMEELQDYTKDDIAVYHSGVNQNRYCLVLDRGRAYSSVLADIMQMLIPRGFIFDEAEDYLAEAINLMGNDPAM